MAKVACLTLDLEPDLRAPDRRVRLLEDDGKLEWLLALLKRKGVPLTCFTVMSMGERYGERLRALAREADIEFAVHSFSHDRAQPASDCEVERSWQAFGELFKAPPRGYRSPNCLIDHAGLARLARRGFATTAASFRRFGSMNTATTICHTAARRSVFNSMQTVSSSSPSPVSRRSACRSLAAAASQPRDCHVARAPAQGASRRVDPIAILRPICELRSHLAMILPVASVSVSLARERRGAYAADVLERKSPVGRRCNC